MYVQAKRREGQGVWAVEELERTVIQTPTRKIIRLPMNINDPAFAQAIVDEFLKICPSTP